MPVRAVLFDLGDTLWHIPEPPPVDAVRQETVRRISDLLRSWGVDPEGELYFLGRDIRLAVERAISEAYAGDLQEPDYGAIAREVAAQKGLHLTPEQGDQLWETWNLGGSFFGRRLFEGALETLDALRARGYRIGCVTNRSFGGPAFVQEVESHGLAPYFEAMAVSCDIGYMKPHPKAFEPALRELRIEPREAVMVGDSLRADVGGAKALGMTAIWRRPANPAEEMDGIQPDFVVDELREIPDLPIFA